MGRLCLAWAAGGVPTLPSLTVPLGVSDSASLGPECLPGVGSSPTALTAMARQGHSSLCGLNLGRGLRDPRTQHHLKDRLVESHWSWVRGWEAADPQG